MHEPVLSVLPAPLAAADPLTSHREADRREVSGAIALVACGDAVAVVLCGLHAPEAAAADLEARATEAGIALRVDRDELGQVALVVARDRM